MVSTSIASTRLSLVRSHHSLFLSHHATSITTTAFHRHLHLHHFHGIEPQFLSSISLTIIPVNIHVSITKKNKSK
ncbi:hypothetical protein YC2023_043173 [Brassica napus]